jgi:hypothetical protein
MIKFYFHYDRERKKATLVIETDNSKETYWVNEIICNVPVRTKFNDIFPHFVVEGECNEVWHSSNSITIK